MIFRRTNSQSVKVCFSKISSAVSSRTWHELGLLTAEIGCFVYHSVLKLTHESRIGLGLFGYPRVVFVSEVTKDLMTVLK